MSSTPVPILAILVSMVLPTSGIIFLDIEQLVMMNSGGSLICFCLTNVCVIVGRYQPPQTHSKGLYTSAEHHHEQGSGENTESCGGESKQIVRLFDNECQNF